MAKATVNLSRPERIRPLCTPARRVGPNASRLTSRKEARKLLAARRNLGGGGGLWLLEVESEILRPVLGVFRQCFAIERQ